VTIAGSETLGRETLLKVQLAGTTTLLNLLANPEWSQRVGEAGNSSLVGTRLAVQLAPEWLFIFDPSTGQRLYPDR
jgi:multiple sugar transport system ATP-binding protein